MEIKSILGEKVLIEWRYLDHLNTKSYMINRNGEVKRLKNSHSKSNGRIEEDIILIQCNSTGYKVVTLFIDGKRKRHYIHRLLAFAFLPNTENKPCINHINGNRSDNRLDNLEWCTYRENSIHAYKILKRAGKTGKDSHFYGKLGFNAKKVFCQNSGYFYDSVMEAAKSINASPTYLAKCLRGERPNKTNLIYAD
jgi:hypothetical protein